MAKYNKRIVKRITDLIRQDTFTIAEICRSVRISEECFYKWQRDNEEFKEAVTRAREQFDEIIVREAKNSLRKLVNGYEADEKKTVFVNGKDGKPEIKEQVTIKKHFQPNPMSVQFVLTNKTGGEYKNYQTNELTGKDGKELFASLSDEELDNRIKALEDKLKKK